MNSTRPAVVTLVVTLSLLVCAANVPAQETGSAAEEALETATPDEVGQQAADLMARLDGNIIETRGYQERLAAASAEDSLVLRLQLAGSRDRFMAALQDLSGLVVDSEDDETHHELRDRAVVVFTEITPRIWALIGDLRAEIDGLRATRPAAAAADRSALEDRIILLTHRLDSYYRYGRDHLQNLEALGQETEGARAIFIDLVSTRADELSGRLQLAVLRAGDLNSRLKETPGDTDATALLVANRKNLDANVASQALMLDIMEGLELPTDTFRTQLLAMTQDLASGLLDPKVAATLFTRAWEGLVTWVSENGPTFLVKVLLFLLIIVAGRYLARLVRKAVQKSLDRANVNLSQLLRHMIVNAAHNTVVVLALLIALSQLGISLGPLLAGFGVIGFILGFAMQDSLSNLAAGMMILINRPYDVGDLVEIATVFGKVSHMSMVSTSILTLDNQKLVVPNSKIWGDVIKNVTDQRIRRVDLVFGISYSDDIPKAEGVLNEILAAHESVLDDPESMVRVHALGESSVDFIVRPWVNTPDYWDVHWDVTRAVKMRFDEEGISIPFPQRDVHIFETKPAHHSGSPEDGFAESGPVAHDPDEVAGNEG